MEKAASASGLADHVAPSKRRRAFRDHIPEASHVLLAIYDILRQEVQGLVEDFVDAGYRSVVWDAKEVAGRLCFVRMEAGDFVEVRKMALIR